MRSEGFGEEGKNLEEVGGLSARGETRKGAGLRGGGQRKVAIVLGERRHRREVTPEGGGCLQEVGREWSAARPAPERRQEGVSGEFLVCKDGNPPALLVIRMK